MPNGGESYDNVIVVVFHTANQLPKLRTKRVISAGLGGRLPEVRISTPGNQGFLNDISWFLATKKGCPWSRALAPDRNNCARVVA